MIVSEDDPSIRTFTTYITKEYAFVIKVYYSLSIAK